MDYKKLLQERYKAELDTISMLKQIELTFQSYPINWNKLHLPEFEIGLKKAEYSLISPYKDLMHITGPVVYYYEIIKGNPGTIRAILDEYKRKKERTCPPVKQDRYSLILYVGSETKSFARRTVEHMGLAHKDTGGLQLLHWASDSGIKLRLHYCKIDVKHVAAIRHVEAALAKHLNPVIGKIER